MKHLFLFCFIGMATVGCMYFENLDYLEQYIENDTETDLGFVTDLATDSDTHTDKYFEDTDSLFNSDSESDTDSLFNSDSDIGECSPGIEVARVCNVEGNVATIDDCGGVISEVEQCNSNGRICNSGICSCPAGWTGDGCAQCVVYVNGAIVDDSGHGGRSWDEAFSLLQVGIDAASGLQSCEIWVAQGTYLPGSDRQSTFVLHEGSNLVGGFVGDETEKSQRNLDVVQTVLSGDIGGDDSDGFLNMEENAIHVMTGADNIVIDGFVFLGGNANSTFIDTDNDSDLDPLLLDVGQHGGCLTISGSISATILNCTFKHCSALGNGSAISSVNHTEGHSALLIENSTFTNNIGSAVFLNKNTGKIQNCDFLGNSGGGLVLDMIDFPGFWVVQSRFVGNTSEQGGAINITGTQCLYVQNSLFQENSAQNGGGIYSYSSKLEVANSIFSYNQAYVKGGAATIRYGTEASKFVNCTLWENSAEEKGAIADFFRANLDLSNSILWQGTDFVSGISQGMQSTINIIYSNIKGGCDDLGTVTCGAGNIEEIPKFVNPKQANFNLNSSSSCVDSGDNSVLPTDIQDMDSDQNVGEDLVVDYHLNLRVTDGNGDGASIVDIGAIEYQP